MKFLSSYLALLRYGRLYLQETDTLKSRDNVILAETVKKPSSMYLNAKRISTLNNPFTTLIRLKPTHQVGFSVYTS